MTTAIDPGPAPELAWLPVSKLTVDHTYQRTLESRRSQTLVTRIAETFRWSAFQAILAVTDGSGWIVIDGQHRVEAARRIGIQHVPAVVVAAASIAEQAAAFVQANLDRVSVNAFALHHARLAAKDDKAARIDRVCRAAGVSIPKYPIPADKLKPGQTLALTTIGRLADGLGEDTAKLVLKTIRGAFPDEPGAVKASLCTAIGKLAETPVTAADRRALFDRLAVWLKGQRAADLCIKAVQRKHSYGGTEVSNLVDLLRRGAAAAAMPAAGADGAMKAPDRARLMAGR